jgi:hypothetical protein
MNKEVDKADGKVRHVYLVPMMQQIPLQPNRRTSLMSGAGNISDPVVRDQIMVGRLGNVQRVFNSKRRMSVL